MTSEEIPAYLPPWHGRPDISARLAKEDASRMSKIAAGGTTTAIVLTEALLKEAYKNLAEADAMALNRSRQPSPSVWALLRNSGQIPLSTSHLRFAIVGVTWCDSTTIRKPTL